MKFIDIESQNFLLYVVKLNETRQQWQRELRNNCIITSRSFPAKHWFNSLLVAVLTSRYIRMFSFSAPDAWAQSQPANMAQIQDMEVQCEKDLFRVSL